MLDSRDGPYMYFGAFSESPEPNERVFLIFNRQPKNDQEAEDLIKKEFCLADDWKIY